VTYSPEAVTARHRGYIPPEINLCMEILITLAFEFVGDTSTGLSREGVGRG